MKAKDMTDEQVVALARLCDRYNEVFDAEWFTPDHFDLPEGYVAGWVGGPAEVLYVGCSPEGEISS